MSVETQAFVAYLISLGLVILMKVVCFILGYLTVRLGYQLIASGVKGEFKFAASMGGLKADLASVSPGLLFVLLGVLLIGYAIYVEKVVKVNFPPAQMTRTTDALPVLPEPPNLTRDERSKKK